MRAIITKGRGLNKVLIYGVIYTSLISQVMMHGQPTPEKPTSSPDLWVLLVRHAAYETVATAATPEAVGGLSAEGRLQAANLGEAVFDRAKASGKPTDVLFISSPTPYDANAGQYRRRADETADIAMERMLALMEGGPADHIRLLGPVPDNKSAVPYHKRLVEPNIHYVEGAGNPRAYVQAQLGKFGVSGRKEGYWRGDEEVDAVARRIGAETAVDVGRRGYSVVEDMAQLAEVHRREQPDRDFLVVLVTHDDVVRAVVQNEMGAGAAAYSYSPGFAEAVPLSIVDSKVTMEFGEQVYNRRIPI